MGSPETSNKVLIIGAGPGGLALAQILRRYNIPFEIFERDEERDTRSQGWAVALIEALPQLIELLPNDLGDLYSVSVNYGVSDTDTVGVINPIANVFYTTMGGVPRGKPGYVLRASRVAFRNFLWDKINVSEGKAFTHYTEDDDGVTAFFKDGTSARGSVLIGADSARSRVRAAMFNGTEEAVLSQFQPITGQAEMLKTDYEPIRKLGNAAALLTAPGLRTLIGLRSITLEKPTATLYWILGYLTKDLEAEAAWLETASQEELYKLAVEKASSWPDYLSKVVRASGVEGVFAPPIKFWEWVPPDTLPGKRVTLLGDAAHPMIPFRGGGANTALIDACELAILLAQAHEEKLPLHSVLSEYEKVMLPRGQKMVLTSRAAGVDDEAFIHLAKVRGRDG